MTNKKKIILAIIIVLSLIFSFFCGNTFSKYVTEVNGVGNAEIAKWSFQVNGDSNSINTIELAKTQENAEKFGYKLVPGSKGKFDIQINAQDSEVGIEYKVEFSDEQNKPTNLKFKYKDKIVNSIQELEEDLTGTINTEEIERNKILQIEWEWKYETGDNKIDIEKNDLLDTQEAQKANNYHFNIVVTGTQIMPKNE